MLNRREFLKTAAVATVPLFISSRALGMKKPGANDIINVGLIGLGGRCRDIVRTCLQIPQMRVAAICDCFKPRIAAFMKEKPADAQWQVYTDFRKMIETEQLDGVMVETTTHARAWIACIAMTIGMDVYI